MWETLPNDAQSLILLGKTCWLVLLRLVVNRLLGGRGTFNFSDFVQALKHEHPRSTPRKTLGGNAVLLIRLCDHVRNEVRSTWHEIACICDLGLGKEALIYPDLLDERLHGWNEVGTPDHRSFTTLPIFYLRRHLIEARIEHAPNVEQSFWQVCRRMAAGMNLRWEFAPIEIMLRMVGSCWVMLGQAWKQFWGLWGWDVSTHDPKDQCEPFVLYDTSFCWTGQGRIWTWFGSSPSAGGSTNRTRVH